MAHKAQFDFVNEVKKIYPKKFEGVVVDFGSYDINGSFRPLVEGTYIGVDQQEGPNVDVVCKCKDFDKCRADLILSGEMLEHDPTWRESLLHMYEVLEPGGLIILTVAAPGREPHGHSWYCDHYKNLSVEDIKSVWDCDELFKAYRLFISGFDLYFWGIKR